MHRQQYCTFPRLTLDMIMARTSSKSSRIAPASRLRQLLSASLCAIVVAAGMAPPAKSEDRPALPRIACCSQERADLRLYLRTQEITGRFVPATLAFRSLALSSTPRAGFIHYKGDNLHRAGRLKVKLPQITPRPRVRAIVPNLRQGPGQTAAVRSDLALEISRDRLRLRLSTGPVPHYEHRLRLHPYKAQDGFSRRPAHARHPRLAPIGNSLGRLR